MVGGITLTPTSSVYTRDLKPATRVHEINVVKDFGKHNVVKGCGKEKCG